MKKCPYCKDKFNWEEAVPSSLLPMTIAEIFPFPAMVHKHRWRNGRIENYQKCEVLKFIFRSQ